MSYFLNVIQPSGILDGTRAGQFREEITDAVREGATVILIDFQEVTFMDSSGLGALVLSLKTARTAGAELFLCSINEQIQMLFELTNMDRVFEIFDNREEFERKRAIG
ncbi:STAS domain-containing protein [Pannus brasiliensis CCIBt3594]|uniref:Anti-sigma factor antagonist n=1 Tax=Pannus brasiliensis CCIBt3594 TaxID=1427578 RepID=A0AAW9QWN5_9CHRO